MKQRYRLFRRHGVFYTFDNLTGKQHSLKARDREKALRLLCAKNQAHEQPALNLQMAKTYLMASDPASLARSWQHVMEEMGKTKHGNTLERWRRAMNDRAFELIRNLKLLETHAEHFLQVLEEGTVSTNVFLRRIHNFALDMNWLPCPLIPKRQWPEVEFGEKRAITADEHQQIIARETNPERRAFYELCWHLGGSQSDIGSLCAEDIDWTERTLAYRRQKTDSPALIHLGDAVVRILQTLPKIGPLFPNLSRVRSCDRATEFKQRCRGLGIAGVTLHSYRYSWAERARTAGYPERFAQEALGHNSKAVHRAYAKKALVQIPSLEEFERQQVEKKIVGINF
jgi:integrase